MKEHKLKLIRRHYLPVEGAVALFFIIHVVAFVFATIGPLEETRALHLVVVPPSTISLPSTKQCHRNSGIDYGQAAANLR